MYKYDRPLLKWGEQVYPVGIDRVPHHISGFVLPMGCSMKLAE